MWNGKYVKLDTIIEKIFRDTPFVEQLSYSDALEWTYEAMSLIRATIPYLDKVTDGSDDNYPPIYVDDYRCELPPDLYELKGVRLHGSNLSFRKTTDVFHISKKSKYEPTELTYTVNNSYLFLSVTDVLIEVAYKAYPIDCEGKPLIPDNDRYIKAVQYYIIERLAFRSLLEGKIDQLTYDYLSRLYSFYAGGAFVSMVIPDYATAEAIKNITTKLISKGNYGDYNYKYLADKTIYRGYFTNQ
ncbi:MAG: hypothetical protein HPY57_12815 [Ignavibacteria bacterium]|nr:hypothetical protein [Ignavibacteria bacterium]